LEIGCAVSGAARFGLGDEGEAEDKGGRKYVGGI